MRIGFLVGVMGVIGLGALVGCGSDGGGGPDSTGTGGAAANGGTGGASAGSSGANAGNGGASGKGTGGGGGMGAGPNEYPSGKPVGSCFGDCPLGECDNAGFWSPTPCLSVYQAPVDQSSSYCGATDGSYCLQVEDSFGERYAVQCASGKATIHHCARGCGSAGSGPHVCS